MYGFLEVLCGFWWMARSIPRGYLSMARELIARVFLIPHGRAADSAVLDDLYPMRLSSSYGDSLDTLLLKQAKIAATRAKVRDIPDWRFRWLYYVWLDHYQVLLDDDLIQERTGFAKKSQKAYEAARAREQAENEKYKLTHNPPRLS